MPIRHHFCAFWPGLALPCLGLAWPGLAWPGLAWPGLAWPGLAWCAGGGRRVGAGREPGGSRKVCSLCRPHTHMQYCYPALREDNCAEFLKWAYYNNFLCACLCVCVWVWAAEAPDFLRTSRRPPTDRRPPPGAAHLGDLAPVEVQERPVAVAKAQYAVVKAQ